jgi:hypothetical protein
MVSELSHLPGKASCRFFAQPQSRFSGFLRARININTETAGPTSHFIQLVGDIKWISKNFLYPKKSIYIAVTHHFPIAAWESCKRFEANQARLKMGILAYILLHMIRPFYVWGKKCGGPWTGGLSD